MCCRIAEITGMYNEKGKKVNFEMPDFGEEGVAKLPKELRGSVDVGSRVLVHTGDDDKHVVTSICDGQTFIPSY